jgi:hypothetical protein
MLVAGKQAILQAKTQPVAFLGLKDVLEILSEAKGGGETSRSKRLRHITEKVIPDVSQALNDGKVKLADAERLIDQPAALQKKAIHDVQIGRAKTVKEVLDRNQAPPVDANGVELPDNVRDDFASKHIQSILVDIRANIRDLRASCADNVWLRLPQAIEYLENARAALENAVPHAVHPRCKGKGCPDCRHAGWVPEAMLLELEATGRWECSLAERELAAVDLGEPGRLPLGRDLFE